MTTPDSNSVTVEQSPGREFAADLRKLADLLDEHPELAGPYPEFTLNRFVDDADELRELIRQVGGDWRKNSHPHFLVMSRRIGDRVAVDVNIYHEQVCERVVVGQRTVQRPAPDAPMVTVTEDIVEWRCPESLLSPAPDRDDDKPLTEAQMFEGAGVPYGLAVKADEMARKRRLPHQLREDATGRWPR